MIYLISKKRPSVFIDLLQKRRFDFIDLKMKCWIRGSPTSHCITEDLELTITDRKSR